MTSCDEPVAKKLEEIFLATVTMQRHRGILYAAPQFEVIDVQRIVVPGAIAAYESKLNMDFMKYGQLSVCEELEGVPDNEFHLTKAISDPTTYNPRGAPHQLLGFHGSSKAAVEQICKHGFAAQMASVGLFGRGMYAGRVSAHRIPFPHPVPFSSPNCQTPLLSGFVQGRLLHL